MCGLLFARPQVPLAEKEIFPEIDYLNARTGPHVHIFVAGCYSKYLPEFSFPNGLPFRDERSVGRNWNYSDFAFDLLRRDLESRTSWKYGDGVELLLTNAMRNQRAVQIDLQKARTIGRIQQVAQIIGSMANYCESHPGDDPTWGFSDSMGLSIGRSSLWHLLLSFLPEGVRSDADTARLFVTVNLKKK